MASALASVNFGEELPHTLEPIVSRNCIRERLRDALRLHAGRGRRYSVQELAHGSGVPAANIEKAMQPVDSPDFRPLTLENLASIAKFLGAPFASAILEPCGLGAFELMDEPPLPRTLTADSAKPAETPREKVERLQRELFNAVEELTA